MFVIALSVWSWVRIPFAAIFADVSSADKAYDVVSVGNTGVRVVEVKRNAPRP